MSKPPLPPKLETFLAQPNPSVIATVPPNGHPHTAATWYLWEDGRVLVNMDATRTSRSPSSARTTGTTR